MKKVLIYFLTVIISAFIPIYFFFIWEPLNSTEAMNQSLMEEQIVNKEVKSYEINKSNVANGIFDNIESLSNDKQEKINSLINELSIMDIIKANEYFSNLDNKENVEKGFEFLNKRMNSEKYNELRNIIINYIDLEK